MTATPRNRTAVELFAGGGGLAMAVRGAGFRPLLLNEFAKRACQTLAANLAVHVTPDRRPAVPGPGDRVPLVPGDVRNLDMTYLNGRVGVLAGGPPCQPFSLGGVARGHEDERNMFPQLFRAMREIQPDAVICENVQGLLRPSFAPYFEHILRGLRLPFVIRRDDEDWITHDARLTRALDSPGDPRRRYRVIHIPVNAADHGVPQIRRRVIIVGFRADLDVDLDAFRDSVRPRYSETAWVRSLRSGDYWDRHPGVPDHVRRRVNAALPSVMPSDDGLLPWRTTRDAFRGIRPGERALPDIPDSHLDRVERGLGGVTDHIGWPGARIYPGHTPNELDRPAKTVKAGVHGVPGGESVLLCDTREPDPSTPGGWRYRHRYMSVRETARVMTFPDSWILEGPRGEQMRQLGNAVPPLLGEVFASAVDTALDKAHTPSTMTSGASR